MKFTGERLVPGISNLENMIVEELGRLNFARDYFQNVPALDFGCGAGYAANFMFEQGAASVVGIDISAEAINFAQKKYGPKKSSYAQMNCLHPALVSETFEFICSLDVIEHLSNSQTTRFLSEIVRLLAPGGCCLIATPNKLHTSLNSEPSWHFHLKEFFYDELYAVLSDHFNKVEIFGGRVPIYEDRAIRKVTDSPLSRIKHFLPPQIRVGFSSILRYLLKSDLKIEDVKITKEEVEKAKVFVALCFK